MSRTDVINYMLEHDKKRRNTDYPALHKELQDEAKHLKGDYLKELIYTAKVLRFRQGHSEAATIPERPPAAELAPCTSLGPDEPSAGYDGKSGKRPLGQESPENSAGIGGDCGNCGIENTPLYSFTTVSEEQTIDVCAECLCSLRQAEAMEKKK